MPIVDETLKELFGILLGWMEYSHYKCDLENDRDCYAEQYGDGSATSDHSLVEGCLEQPGELEMRTFRLVLEFQAESEVEAGMVLVEKFHPLVKEMRQSFNEVIAYVEEVSHERHEEQEARPQDSPAEA